jgi:hypothetical protein
MLALGGPARGATLLSLEQLVKQAAVTSNEELLFLLKEYVFHPSLLTSARV